MAENKKDKKNTITKTNQTSLETITDEKKEFDNLNQQEKEIKVAELKENIEDIHLKEKENDMRPVLGTFKNFQSPSLETVFSCRKYPDEPITTYRVRDGEVREFPYYVAKMLRQSCYYTRNKRYKGTDGVESIKIGEKKKLLDFYPHSEFIEGTEAENSIIQVKTRK